MRNGNKHMERKGYKTNEVRVGLSEIKELSKSSVKTARAITNTVLSYLRSWNTVSTQSGKQHSLLYPMYLDHYVQPCTPLT